jgi:putative ABC transport system substrate-binding protein
MNRRTFLSVLASTPVWPVVASAQHADRAPIVGLLVTHPPLTDPMFESVRTALRQFGYEDGVNIRIEIRTALGRLERVPGIAQQLVALKPAAIIVVNEIAIRALKKATSTVPIVMMGQTANDPMAIGLIDSYARPGGNVTGIFAMNSMLVAKRLEVLKEALPNVSLMAVLWDSTFGRHQLDELQRAAQLLGLELQPTDVRSPQDLEVAFKSAKRNGAGALILSYSPWFWVHKERIAELALREKLPTISEYSEFVKAGGLLSYGSSSTGNWVRAAYYVDRLLKGAKVADLPVEQISTFNLAINLKTAKVLGVAIPQSVLLRADEVIR